MQDPRTVQRLRKGDGNVLKRLFKTHFGDLYPMAFRLTHTEEAAGEVIRAAFTTLWNQRDTLDPFEPLSQILTKYVYEAANAYRHANGLVGIASVDAESDPDPSVARCLDRLDERQRLVYMLCVVDGYSFKNLARAFDTTKVAVQEEVGEVLIALDTILQEEEQSLDTPTPALL